MGEYYGATKAGLPIDVPQNTLANLVEDGFMVSDAAGLVAATACPTVPWCSR
jgi:hypothetical protein